MNFRKFLEQKGISVEDFQKKESAEQAKLHGEYLDELAKSLESMAKASDIVAIKETIEDLKKNGLGEDQLKELTTKVDDVATKILEITSKGNMSRETVETQVKAFIEKNHTTIKQLKTQGHGIVEFEIKAVGNMTTGSATNPDGIPEIIGVQVAPPGNVNLRTPWVLPLTTNLNTSLAAYPYTETVPKDGDYAFVAEGTEKPQIDFKIETRYAQPVKVAAWIRLTDEAVQDIPGLQSIATDYLRKKHDLKKQNGILFGDGTAPNPKGATEYGRAFVAGNMAGKVVNPNIMDVINAAATDIYTTHNYEDEMEYMPSIAALHPVDFFIQFVAAKNSFGEPLYPTASLFNMVNIGGMMVIPARDIPAGKIFVADMSKYNTTNYIPYTVKIGWINDDFIKNQFVILGESRFHAFVKRLDEQAFIYDDIDTIKAAIELSTT